MITGRIGLILTGLIIIAVLAAGCSGDTEIKAPSADSDSTLTVQRPDTQIRDAHIFLYNGSVRTTDLKAAYIEKYEKQDSTLAWELDVRFFDSTGAEVSHLLADSGLVRERINFLEVYGHVLVTTRDSARLRTTSLAFDSDREMIRTDDFVRIVHSSGTLQGYGLESDLELKKIKILKKTSGVLQDEELILD